MAAALAAFFALLAPTAASAQHAARVCGADTGYASSLEEEVESIVTGTDHESVAARGVLPSMRAADVAIVSIDSVCARALDAYVAHDTSGVSSTRVYVIRAGHYYFVADPDSDNGDGVDVEVFDERWRWVMSVDE